MKFRFATDPGARGRTAAIVAGCLCAVALFASDIRPAGAEHFDILLRVQSPSSQGESSMDTTPPIGGVNPRPIVKARAGDRIKVTWRIKSGFPHGVMKNAGVHFFVVREEQIGQKPVPNPAGPAGLVNDSFNMDFQPTSEADGAISFVVSDRGNFLVRLQSENTHDEHGHEHFSAIDLKVE